MTLRLKLLADAGLIGLPNAGKSSLLSRLTRAHPKVADYPFTTLEPALGTLDADDRQLVIADIPGLIEGASAGAGLGHEFLAHVERTRLLVHVLDLAPLDGSDPADNFAAIEHELALHDPRLAALPRILALSKADLVDMPTRERQRDRWAQRLGPGVPVIVTSAVARIGLDELARELIRRIPARPVETDTDAPAAATEAARDGELAEHRVFRPAAERGFEVQRTGEGSYRVSREGDRAPGGPLRPRQRGRARPSGAAAARDRRDRPTRVQGVRARRRGRDRGRPVRPRSERLSLRAHDLEH